MTVYQLQEILFSIESRQRLWGPKKKNWVLSWRKDTEVLSRAVEIS